MNVLKTWTPQVVLPACVFWIALWATVLSGPYRQAVRWARDMAGQAGISAVSFSVRDLLGRLAVVFLPPAALIAAWVIARRSS
jgi:hypothetical protein